jgi:hypothetical protein
VQHNADLDDGQTVMSKDALGGMDHVAEEVYDSKGISHFQNKVKQQLDGMKKKISDINNTYRDENK